MEQPTHMGSDCSAVFVEPDGMRTGTIGGLCWLSGCMFSFVGEEQSCPPQEEAWNPADKPPSVI